MNPNAAPPFRKEKKLKVLVFFSWNASSITHLQDLDPNYNSRYIISAAFTNSVSAPGIRFFETHTNVSDVTKRIAPENRIPIPCITLDWKDWKKKAIRKKREKYFESVLTLLSDFSYDVILCAGFHLLIPDTFIQECPVPIINEHPADLSIIDPATGLPLYAGRGIDAITKTIIDGNTHIRSTVHFVEPGPVDSGRIICHSPKAILEKSADPQKIQGRMKLICSGQAIARALEMIINGEVSLEK